MLSSEGSALTWLILARHTLICRALELDAEFEVLSLLESARDRRSGNEAPIDAFGPVGRDRRRLSVERMLLPFVVNDVESGILQAWRRLDTVSPKIFG